MHAYLIAARENSKSIDQISKLIEEHHAKKLPFILQKIEDARELTKITSLSFKEKTAVIIENIDAATEEAQNAFLKNLEEPQKNIIFILTAKNINNVIPTIISRCNVLEIRSSKFEARNSEEIQSFLGSNINDRFEYVGKIKDRQVAVDFVENLIFQEKDNGNYANMDYYLTCLTNLKSNGNVSLQLINLVVKMNSR